MKKLKIFVATALFVITSFSFASCNLLGGRLNEYRQEVAQESIERIENPDQGFYSPVCIPLLSENYNDKTYVIKDDRQLYHLRMDISAFSSKYNGGNDLPLDNAALTNLENTLNKYYEKDKSVVIRFAYDHNYEGVKDQEPSLDMMVTHVKQICGVLNKFRSTISAIEVGMVGPWGEMHSSACAKDGVTISSLIDTYLKETTSFPVLVRTPAMIYNYLNITIDDIDNYVIEQTDLAYRLGLFDDGYLGSESDLGTYNDREKEINWIKNQTGHLPFGGEVVVPSSSLHNVDVCLPEMDLINLSYLNKSWNDAVIDKWKKTYYDEMCGKDAKYYGQTAYTYIENHLGYRFVLKESNFKYNENYDDIEVELKIDNVGFGNLNKEKYLYVYIVDEGGKVHKKDLNIKTKDLSCTSLKFKLDGVKGKVYLGVKDKDERYPIRFANVDIYNSDLNANYIGCVK